MASPATKDALRRRNIQKELVPSDPENTDALEQLLFETGADSEPAPQHKDTQNDPFIIKLNLKRLRGQEAVDEIAKRQKLSQPQISEEIIDQSSPRNTTPSTVL